jgi:hypothetical protein
MAADDKKTKAAPESKPDPAPKDAATTKDKGKSDAEPSKTGGGESAASHSRGEGQKPVSQAYRDNWNLIFGKKKRR